MKIGIRNYLVPMFQEGGAMPPQEDTAPAPEDQGAAPEEGAAPEQGAPEDQGGQDPVMQLAQMAMQALQGQDCEAAMAVCQGFVQLVQQMAQGGGGEAGPEQAPEGEPVYRAGGKLVGRI